MSEIRTEHAFEVDSAPAEVWRGLSAARADRVDDAAPADEWWLPGWSCRCTLLSANDDAMVFRKDDEPCAGTTIVVEVRHAASGSSIRVVQSGFDAEFVARAEESFWTHAERIAADFELYVRRGLIAGRAWRWPRVDLGLRVHTDSSAVVVDDVRPDSWAAAVGLVPGDLVLALAGASIYDSADLFVAQQTLDAGTEVSVVFAHGAVIADAVRAV
jgi:hypothetical protein